MKREEEEEKEVGGIERHYGWGVVLTRATRHYSPEDAIPHLPE
jgi:hypothetical protein